ncbi:hypothetical protein ACWD5W_34560 [Streptomyces sp. NPDC002455]
MPVFTNDAPPPHQGVARGEGVVMQPAARTRPVLCLDVGLAENGHSGDSVYLRTWDDSP